MDLPTGVEVIISVRRHFQPYFGVITAVSGGE